MTFKVKWWQLFFYELAFFSLGVAATVRWRLFFNDYSYLFFGIFLVCGAYTVYALSRQVEK